MSWTGSLRQFRQENSRTHIRVWSISVTGPHVDTTWGVLGGQMQQARETHVGVNHGKANYLSPEAYALDRAEEQIRKKRREGYREYDSNGQAVDSEIDTRIDFNNLSDSLCFYKPDNSLSVALNRKALNGAAWYSRKRNGMAYILARGTGKPMLYSRRMLRHHDNEVGGPTWDDRFPHLIEMAERVLPENSILLGELVMNRQGEDDFTHVQTVTKSLTDRALQEQQEKGLLSFYIWDIAFWRGEDMVSTAPVRDRYDLIHELPFDGSHLLPVEVYYPGGGYEDFNSPEHAQRFAIHKGWEGFVVVDPDGVYGDRAFNFKGKPDRPGSYCGKLKPEFEDDFIAYWNPEKGYGEKSTKGRYDGGIKSVALYQLNSRGEQVYICQVSSGMTEEMKRDWARPELYPMVWRVKYTERTYISQGDDTNALMFPRFDAVRTDKTVSECINPNL